MKSFLTSRNFSDLRTAIRTISCFSSTPGIVGAPRELPSDPRLLGDAHAGLCEPPGAHCEDDMENGKWQMADGEMAD